MSIVAGFADISLPQLLLVAFVALLASLVDGLAGYGTGALMPMVGAGPVVPWPLNSGLPEFSNHDCPSRQQPTWMDQTRNLEIPGSPQRGAPE